MAISGSLIAKRTLSGDHLRSGVLDRAVVIHLFASSLGFSIDSTGEKLVSGHFKVTQELVNNLSEAYLIAYLTDPSATDAEVQVQLYNVTDGTKEVTLTYSGEGGYKESANIADVLKALVGKVVCGRVEVTTASATSGASQAVKCIALLLIYKF